MNEKKRRILVVDDDPEMVSLLTGIFEDKNWIVEAHTSSSEAIATLNTTAYSSILTDLVMPKPDGMALIAKAKGSHLNTKTPCYIMSGALDAQAVQKVSRLKIATIITKPFKVNEVLDIIDAGLAEKHKDTPYNDKILNIYQESINEVFEFYFNSVPCSEAPVIKYDSS